MWNQRAHINVRDLISIVWTKYNNFSLLLITMKGHTIFNVSEAIKENWHVPVSVVDTFVYHLHNSETKYCIS